jgi:hypothetical protein
MATDNEQLVLSISADVRQIQRQMKSLVGQTQRDTKAIEDAFGGIDKAASGAFDGVAANSNRAFGVASNGARQFDRAMNSSRLQTANLSAQLNDIGVQLAGGQSPFLIALQQGTQINQVLGQGGARAAVGALAGAFTSLINPVSLATIAIITLGGAAVQYFTNLLSDSDKSEESLEKQAQLIRNLAAAWGEGIPAIDAYIQKIDQAKTSADALAAVKIVADQLAAPTAEAFEDLNIELAGLKADLIAFGDDGSRYVSNLGDSFETLRESVSEGKATQEQFNAVVEAAQAASVTGISGIEGFLASVERLRGAAIGAAVEVAGLNAAMGGANNKALNDPNTWRGRNIVGQPDGPMQGSADPDLPFDGPVIERRPLIELEGLSARSPSGGGRSSAVSEAQREREVVTKLIEQLEFEQSLISMSDADREVANTLRRAGAAATDEQRVKIEQLVEATYAEREAIDANQEAMKELQAVGKEVLQGIVSDLRAGKSGADILAGALDRIIDQLATSTVDGLLSGFGNGVGKGGLLGGLLIPGILHSGGVAGQDGYGHGRAVSPSLFAGANRYHTGGVAGLQPGEVPAILQRGEVVLPRGAKMGGGGRVHVTVGVSADKNGNLKPFVESVAQNEVGKLAPSIINKSVSRANESAPAAVGRYQAMKVGGDYRNT